MMFVFLHLTWKIKSNWTYLDLFLGVFLYGLYHGIHYHQTTNWDTLPRTNMEPKRRFEKRMHFRFKGVIFRFQPLILRVRGVICLELVPSIVLWWLLFFRWCFQDCTMGFITIWDKILELGFQASNNRSAFLPQRQVYIWLHTRAFHGVRVSVDDGNAIMLFVTPWNISRLEPLKITQLKREIILNQTFHFFGVPC